MKTITRINAQKSIALSLLLLIGVAQAGDYGTTFAYHAD